MYPWNKLSISFYITVGDFKQKTESYSVWFNSNNNYIIIKCKLITDDNTFSYIYNSTYSIYIAVSHIIE